eukprot:gnl/Chilomastix_cuspidata/5137.p1 GENE.gnl/Chilomastix_cuspidata/5137~~gnl/Chilomastix_cuspidata/5137.p1  ORF type:complete len:576 (-),score=157.92 gnl/Chilomastix_cuspidata/5137:446-2173(-)
MMNIPSIIGFSSYASASPRVGAHASGQRRLKTGSAFDDLDIFENYKICHMHRKELIGLCTDCTQPVCEDCSSCLKHPIQYFRDVVSSEFPEAPHADKVAAIAREVEQSLPSLRVETREAEMKKSEMERIKRAKCEETDDMRRTVQADIEEIERLRQTVAGARQNVTSQSAKDAIDGATERLQIEPQIHEEYESKKYDIHDVHRQMLNAKVEAERLRGELARAEYVSELSEFPKDRCGQGVLAIVTRMFKLSDRAACAQPWRPPASSAELDPHSQVFGVASAQENFVAFDGVQEWEEVSEAAALPLDRVGGIGVSGSVPLHRIRGGPRRDTIASLSAEGIFCAGDSESGVLLVQDFVRGGTKELCGGAFIFGCAYRGELFVCWRGERVMRHAPVADVFRGRPLKSFDEFELNAENAMAPSLDTAPRGWITLAVHSDKPRFVHVNLEARRAFVKHADHHFSCLGGHTGIRVRNAAFVVHKQGDGGGVFASNKGGILTQIARGLNFLPTCIPSAASPSDLTRAAVFDGSAQFSYHGITMRLPRPVKPDGQSLVRLCGDVFLCFDQDTYHWYVLRIVVP